MGKTQSQTVKKEEANLCLYSANNRTSNKITRRKPSIHKNDLPVHLVKLEKDADCKSSLNEARMALKSGTTQAISQEQIEQLIYIVLNDKLRFYTTSRKLKICFTSLLP
jgi:hypothetical protein